jgi:outer membrane protein assembly factor BamB
MTHEDSRSAPREPVIYVAVERDTPPFVRAVDATSGRVAWETALPDEGLSYKKMMLIARGRVVVATGAGNVFCMDHTTGQALWSAQVERKLSGNTSKPMIVAAHGTVLVFLEARLTCFSLDGQKLWDEDGVGLGAIGTTEHVTHFDFTK